MGYPIFDKPMTPAERQRRRRARLRGEIIPPWQPRPKRTRPQFDPDSPLMQGLADLDDLELREFDA